MSQPERVCYCCGRPEHWATPLIETNKGLVCAHDEFCRAGTDRPLIFDEGRER